MSGAILEAGTDGVITRGDRTPTRWAGHSADFLTALFSGGDSRIAADPCTGLNKYLCPSLPAPDIVSVASCTASPISADGFAKAAEAWSGMAHASSPRRRADQLGELTQEIEARLLRYFGAGTLARALLCPSGTDALLTAARLIAAERTGEATTAILPSASETGTGVPLASTGRVFDGSDRGRSLTGSPAMTVEIPLRAEDGSPRSDDEVNDAFAAAAAAATGRAIIYLTHGTKTGLIAPVSPPSGADVVVDACQARIEPATVAAYLKLGWPVVVTGSKFFGGPAFSGAVLYPHARLPRSRPAPFALASGEPAVLGAALRWTAALAVIDAFRAVGGVVANRLAVRAAAIEQGIAAIPALVPAGGLRPRGGGWADVPSIFTFAVRDPADHRRLLPASELRQLYVHLARRGVLLGQPVDLGLFGGLRIAIGARDLLDGADPGEPQRVFTALDEATERAGRGLAGT